MQPHHGPLLIVVMGVSGSGKSTIATALAQHFGFRYLDGDDYHSEEARTRMAKGTPLSDELREPWIKKICSHLKQLAAQGENCVLAFSGLKKFHREPLRHTDFDTLFLFLQGDKATIQQRLVKRTDHFMPPGLLDSQFDSLENPAGEYNVVNVNTAQPLEQVIDQAVAEVSRYTAREP